MATRTYNITFTPRAGALGTQIDYRLQNTTAWTTPTAPANPTTLNSYPLSLTTGQTYNIRLTSIGAHCTPKYAYLTVIVPITGNCCPVGYTLSVDGTYCFREETVSPTITQSDICFATSQLAGQYSSTGTFLYDPGYDIHLNGTHATLTTSYWKEAPASVTGPMNREGVWIDANCDGSKDALLAGASLQYTVPVTLSVPTTLYIGIGGDNTFEVDLNGVVVVNCDTVNSAGGAGPTANFNIWHLFPVNFPAGTSYVTFKGIGDGTTSDCFANVIYNNTSSQLTSATSDGSLTILFKTSSLRGGHLDIATCPSGYFLDTSGGSGSYVCKRKLTQSPFSC